LNTARTAAKASTAGALLRKHQELAQVQVARATSRKRRRTKEQLTRSAGSRAASERDQAFKGLVLVSINIAMVTVQVVATIGA